MSVYDRRVLSIQSHVVSGYVGNKAAVFPMQVLGYEVDFINSVQLCTHTQYKVFKGQVLNADELKCLYDGIKENDINRYSHVLTGYVGSTSFLREVIRVVQDAREANPNMTYVCDPVMGDNGRFYVPEDLMPIYRDELLPLADLVTPNQFEAELLSGIKITNESEALKAMQILHDKGVKTVVLSSYESGKEDTLTLIGTQIKNGKKTGCKVEYPRLNMRFTGTGDVFSALLLVWTHRHPDNLQLACEQVLASMQAILQRTHKEAKLLAGSGSPSPAQSELRLIDSKADIENPPETVNIKGTALNF